MLEDRRAAVGGGCRRHRLVGAPWIWIGAALLVSFAAAARSSAQPAEWRSLGPAGAGIETLSPIAAGAGAVWAGTAGRSGAGAWKSIDGGASWVRAPLPAEGPFVAVAADPSDPLTVYAGTGGGVVKSTDGGASWSLVHAGAPVLRLAVAPSMPAVLYEVESARIFSTSMSRSADGGATWLPATLPHPAISSMTLTVDPAEPDRIYMTGFASTPDGIPFYSFTADGGATWQDLGAPPGNPFIVSLAVDPRNTSTLYAGTSGGGEVFRSADRGASWQPANGGLPDGSGQSLALDPATGALLAIMEIDEIDGTPPQYQIWKTTDGGTTWSRTFQTAAVLVALAVDAGLPGRVYAGAYGLGMLVSDDGGGHWRVADTGLGAVEVIDVTPDPHAPGTLYAAFDAGSPLGMERSTDGGATWVPINQGMGGVTPPDVRRVVADPQTANLLYAAVEDGAVYRSADGGLSWKPLPGLARLLDFLNDLEIDPLRPNVLLAAGTSFDAFDVGSAAALTMDGGATWTSIHVGVTPEAGTESFNAAAFDPSDPQAVFVGGADGLFASSDGGSSWSRRGQTLPPGQAVSRLRLDAAHLLYAVLTPGEHTLLRSADGGLTWTAIDAGLPAGAPVRDLALDPAGAALYAGTDAGVYRSSDGGAHWTAESQGLGEARVTRLVEDPARPGILYAGTPGGLFVAPPPAGPCIALDRVLCLTGGRFAAQVTWRLRDGSTGDGHAVELADANGGFWFFFPESTELLLKMVDGGPVNGHFWVFGAGLSNVAYTLTVTDTLTGKQHTYANAAGALASFADTGTFGGAPHAGDLATVGIGRAGGGQVGSAGSARAGRTGSAGTGNSGNPGAARTGGPGAASALDPRPGQAAAAGCVPASDALCVQGSRFQVQVAWRLPGEAAAPAFAVPFSRDSGAFWFFGPETLELAVKVLDGRALDGHFWVFTAGLSNVDYAVTVTDTATGAVRRYLNPAGELASRFHLF